MAHAGDTFVNRAGEQVIFRHTTKETHGAYLEVEIVYRAHARPPPAHYHPFQTEHSRVLAGEIHTVIGQQTRTYVPAEEFHVAAGVAHAMPNISSTVGRAIWRIQPALQTELFFETLWGLAGDGKTDHYGVPHLLQLAVLLQTYQREFRLSRPPYLVQRPLWSILGILGRLKGYRSHYAKYSDPANKDHVLS